MLDQVRNMLRRFLIVFTRFPLVFFRRLTMLIREVQVIILQVSFRRFTAFTLNLFSSFKDGFTQRASNFPRGRVPGVVNGRSPAIFTFLRDRRVRRNGILRVLTRQDRRQEVASAEPCVNGFIRRLGRGLILHRGQRVIFYLVFISEFRVHFRIYRWAARRATKGSKDSGREVRRAIFQTSMRSRRVIRGLLGRTARLRVNFRVSFQRLVANVLRRDLGARRINVTYAP